jgi:hypothetical protein
MLQIIKVLLGKRNPYSELYIMYFLGIPNYTECIQEHEELDWGLIQMLFNAH